MDRFSKIVRPGRAGGVRSAHERAGVAGFDWGFEVARAWSSDAEEQRGVVHFSVLEGRTLHEIGCDREVSDAAFTEAWRSWGEGWCAVLANARGVGPSVGLARPHGGGLAKPRRGAPAKPHGGDQAKPHGGDLAKPPRGARAFEALPVHAVADEIAVVRTWAAHAQRVLPGRVGGIHRAEQKVVTALAASRPDPLALAHRDLHDKQVLHAPGRRPAVLDLDTASRAEAALDLGNLRAHLAFRTAQGALSAERAEIARRIVDDVADRAGVSPQRLAAYESATALRLGCLYLFRPRWRGTAERWLTVQGA